MTTQLNNADLAFLLQQVIIGPFFPPGTDPLTLQGTRAVDGTYNNLNNVIIIDQYGNQVLASTFGNHNQPFFHIVANPTAGFQADGVTPDGSHYQGVDYAAGLNVVDNQPRVISNLIAAMDTQQSSAFYNPAAVAEGASIIGNEGEPSLFILPTNAFFTYFGQFFDHGLDFIDKGGDGTISGALLGPLDRASRDELGNTNNSTAPLVDQSQTYGSDFATLFYLKEYDANGNPTGYLLTAADGGQATWADVKANALRKGITLVDTDIFDIPEPIFNGAANNYTRGAGIGQAFLADIAHDANPNNPSFFNQASLDAHRVAGDARANENAVLSSIHESFHNEHNRLVDHIKDLIAQQELLTPGFAQEWSVDRIFEAAKFTNEMQYQHFVFEEFGRRLSPNIDAFTQYDVTINPNISLEFSQAIYRLGHSMLNDEVRAVTAGDQTNSLTLVDAFLNPGMYAEVGGAAFVKGQTRLESNEIDEFVTDAVRNMLVGQSLDLAAINIARGRDVGLPTLNQTRADLFSQTGLTTLTPYANWTDFGNNLLHPASLVNFIAAYARGGDGGFGDQLVALREQAGDLAAAGVPPPGPPLPPGTPPSNAAEQAAVLAELRAVAEDAMNDADFMANNQGFWDIDLWIGGLAEAKVAGAGVSAGMLGQTFDFIFAQQMIALQNGDRTYYLARIFGNLLDQVESQKFGELFERGTGARHTNGDIFGAADDYIELSTLQTHTWATTASAQTARHEVVGGTTGNDTITTGAGNDTVWAEDGNDIVYGGNGADIIFGGDGNDLINGGEQNDFLRGEAGDDTINGDAGDDIIWGREGKDTLNGGLGFDEIHGGKGDDTIFGGDADDALFGDEQDDVLSGGLGNDALDGGANNDVLRGDQGADILLGGEGDDMLMGGSGADVLDGGLGGYDVASYHNLTIGITIDMNGVLSSGDALGDTFIDIEEVRGTQGNDRIVGDALANVLVGAGGTDVLEGGGGDDTLYGNLLGADTLNGGIGIDMAVWLGVEWSGNTVDGPVAVNVTGLGDGSVTINGVTDNLAGVELLSFDNGIWSVVTNEWVPMISVLNPTTSLPEPMLELDGQVLDGNQVSSFQLLDNTLIPTGGIRVGQIDIADPDGVRGIQAVTLAGVDAAAFQIRTEPGGVQGLYFVGSNVAGARTNYEVKGHYDITLNVADNSGASAMNYTLKVVDVNDNAPLLTSPEKVHLYSNLDLDAVIYRVTATDLDTSTAVNQTALQYSLWAGAGNDNNLFSLTDNGEVRFANAPTPGSYQLGIQVFDGVNTVQKMVDVVVGGPVVQLTFDEPVLDDDTGASNEDFITSNGNVVLSGTYDVAAPVASIVLMNGNMLIDEATLNAGAGTWSFDGDLPAGIYTALKAVARDVNGATLGQAASPNGIAVDKNAVGAITITSIAGDNMISQAEAGGIVSIVGSVTGEIGNGSTVSLLINGQTFTGTTQGNSFVINVGAAHLVADVDRTVQASVDFVDLAGNTNSANAQRTFVVDITPPAAAIVQINDGDGQIDASEVANLGFGVSGVEIGATATVTFTSSGGGAPVVLSGLGNGAFSANLSGLGNGTINAAITTIDGAGNTTPGTGDISTKVAVLPVPPVVTDLVLDGSGASETLSGGDGNDQIAGKGGKDSLYGLGGNDVLKGGKAKDLLDGGDGDDVLKGGKGKDKLFGGAGNDQLNGGKGKDLLDGGLGDDILHGGAGKDVFVFKTGYGNDVIDDYQAGKDTFDLRGTDVENFNELKAMMAESATGVMIDFGDGDSLIMLDTSIKILKQHKADFDFA